MFKVGDKVRVVIEHALLDPDVIHEVNYYGPGTRPYTKGETYVGLVGNTGRWFPHRFKLVGAPTARSNDPATSKGKRKVNKYEQAVLDCLAIMAPDPMYKGATGKQIAKWSAHPLNCITPRFAPLRRKGLIKPWQVLVNGEYTTIKRDKQIVWVLA
jgi:hypothetical protein